MRGALRFFGLGALALGALGATLALYAAMMGLVTTAHYQRPAADNGLRLELFRSSPEKSVTAALPERPPPPAARPPPPPPPPPPRSRSRTAAWSPPMNLAGLLPPVPPPSALDGDVLAIVRVPPAYPPRAQAAGIGGWVLLEFTVSAAGSAEALQVVGSEPADVFDAAALAAVRRWKYRPRIEDGRARPRAGVRQLIRFEITP